MQHRSAGEPGNGFVAVSPPFALKLRRPPRISQ